ncbi:MAG: DUF5060 domain-containing protein [Planctomycetota bacterium]
MPRSVLLAGTAWLLLTATPAEAQPTGTQWQPIEVEFTGPQGLSETSAVNPFTDYRLQVAFTSGGESFDVPGFFAGVDDQGNSIWKARFTPNVAGDWSYEASFDTGTNVAVDPDPSAGTPTSFDGATGSFNVALRNPLAPGFWSKGRLAYVGEHYLQTQGDEKYFIKSGADSPENLLGYKGFDNTQAKGNDGPGRRGILHEYEPHSINYNAGDPGWLTDDFDFGNTIEQGGDGRNIIGKINYLAEIGVNSVYFMVNNVGGDGQDSHPFTNISTPAQLSGETNSGVPNDNLRYDVSKLEQWEVLFTHAQQQGVQLHMVLNEAEFANKQELDDGTLGVERKLYYREMIARFGHHNGLILNISEEYDLGNGFGSNRDEEAGRVNEFADYIAAIDAYDIPVTVHNAGTNNFANAQQIPINSPYEYFINNEDFDLTSLQRAGQEEGWSDVVEAFLEASANAGRPLAVNVDEPESITRIDIGVNDDTEPGNTNFEKFNTVRKTMTWDILLSGAAGVEWFIHNADQDVEDQRVYEKVYVETAIARRFIEDNLPFIEMTPDDDLVRGADSDYGGAEVFAKEGEVYAIYFPDTSNDDNNIGDNVAETPELNLTLYDAAEFDLRWFNPREGVFVGGSKTLIGGDWVFLGASPDGTQQAGLEDWVALVTLIPEPGTAALLLSCFGLAALRRRG